MVFGMMVGVSSYETMELVWVAKLVAYQNK